MTPSFGAGRAARDQGPAGAPRAAGAVRRWVTLTQGTPWAYSPLGSLPTAIQWLSEARLSYLNRKLGVGHGFMHESVVDIV